jgi:hypothetical protein
MFKKLTFLFLCLFSLTSTIAAQSPRMERHTAYLDRARLLLEDVLANVDVNDTTKGGRGQILACVIFDKHLDWASERLIEDLKQPRGDMFWMIPITNIAFHGRDNLSPEALAAIRHAWKTYMPQRGDTENHWAMYYTCLYLMAEYWPDLPASEWYSGKSSAENLAEAREYLINWINITASIGQGEYDCTHYIGEYLMPMIMLTAWAEDPAMRIRGQMMMDLILADYAVDSLNGLYVGAHARSDDRAILEPHNVLSTMFGWLFFDAAPRTRTSWSLYVAANAPYYEVPEVLYRIATDRPEAYLNFERKRTRWQWRNADTRTTPVYKTTYVHPDYAIGSDQGGLLQPIQQHSWDLTWAVDDPRGVQNSIFSINPHYSDLELQTYFTEYAHYMPEAVTFQGKPSYTADDTFLGGSPYEKIFQHENVIIALYDLPDEAPHKHVNGFFSKDLEDLSEDSSGWIFARGGNTYIAYYPMAPYEWKPIEEGGQRLYSPHQLNGTLLQPASADDWVSWEAFQEAVRQLPLEIVKDKTISVRFTTLGGDNLAFTYDNVPSVNGVPVDYENWMLFNSPFVQSAVGSKEILLRHGNLERLLDFNHLQIGDRVIEPVSTLPANKAIRVPMR